MFLSLLDIDAGADRHQIHSRLESIFGRTPQGDSRSYIWAATEGGILVRSINPPVEGVGIKTRSETVPSTGMIEVKVLLNPVRRSDHGERPIVDPAEVSAWTRSLFAVHGMEVVVNEDDEGAEAPSVWVSRVSSAPIHAPRKDAAVPAFFWSVRAVVTVVDSKAFAAAWLRGLGRKKAYGAGMLLRLG